jgi:hypothetical protein
VLKSVARDVVGDRELIEEVVSAATELFEGAGHPIGGRLWVKATPSDAQVSLEGNPELDSSVPGSFLVPPGRYRVRAFRDGYTASSTEASVLRMLETHSTVTLAPSSGSILASPWVWAIGALAIAGGAVALGFALQNRSATMFCQTDQPSCR